MFKKIIKISLIVLFLILIPTLIVIAILYSNNKELLHKFSEWVNEPGNLSAFIVMVGLYFPFINGIFKLILNIATFSRNRKMYKRDKAHKEKIYDDEKNNYIYYDEKNNVIDFQFKSPEKVNIEKLAEISSIELKEKIKNWTKSKKWCNTINMKRR